MPIIGTLPNNITNGQAVDANPVMADFNFIVNQVNANANPVGTLTAPSGTRAVFSQGVAPLGWTIDATITDHTIQVVGTAGGAVGGATGYSAMFTSQFSTDGHVLTVAELAIHSHTDSGHIHATTENPHAHAQHDATWYNTATGGQQVSVGSPININTAIGNGTHTNVTGLTINTSTANIQNTGSGSAHSHTKQFNAQFVQCNICQKS